MSGCNFGSRNPLKNPRKNPLLFVPQCLSWLNTQSATCGTIDAISLTVNMTMNISGRNVPLWS
jgi:hypothetical protein